MLRGNSDSLKKRLVPDAEAGQDFGCFEALVSGELADAGAVVHYGHAQFGVGHPDGAGAVLFDLVSSCGQLEAGVATTSPPINSSRTPSSSGNARNSSTVSSAAVVLIPLL